MQPVVVATQAGPANGRSMRSFLTEQLRPILEQRRARMAVLAILLVAASMLTLLPQPEGFDTAWMFIVPVALSAIAGGLLEGAAVALAASFLCTLFAVASAGEVDLTLGVNVLAARFALYGLTCLFLGALADVHRSVQSDLRELASLDPLTKVSNVAGFYDRVGALESYPTGFAMMVVDVDDLKALNDRYGHQAGSEAIQAVAAVLRSLVRSSDCVARFGGDEFVVTLKEAGRLGAEIVASRVDEMLRWQDLVYAPGERVTVSQGIAVYGEDGRTTEELLQAADEAMYESKRASKGSARRR